MTPEEEQKHYAITQHGLCCKYLEVAEPFDGDGDTLSEAVFALKKDRDEWKEESALHQKEHERLAKKIDAIESKALEIIPGYGNTGKSTFSTPIAVMGRMRDEIDLLRGELANADQVLQSNISTFLDLRQQVEDLRESLRVALNWIADSHDDQEGRDLIVDPFRAKYFPLTTDSSLDSENSQADRP